MLIRLPLVMWSGQWWQVAGQTSITALSESSGLHYRAFSLTWPASMLIYWNRRKHLHDKRVQLPEGFLGTPTYGHRFIGLEHQYGRRDVMWKRPFCKWSRNRCETLLLYLGEGNNEKERGKSKKFPRASSMRFPRWPVYIVIVSYGLFRVS